MAPESHSYQVGTRSNPGFAQQGQVDWVAFGKTSWGISSAILQRFASADLQPATYGAAIALGCQFSLGARGRARISQALSKLSGTSAFQNILWFGFGQKSFLNVVAANEAAFRCVALCVCLVDTHSLDMAAYVLAELWKLCECPTEYQPAHEQFVSLLKNCEGELATTDFGKTVGCLLGDWSLSVVDEPDKSFEELQWSRCADASQVAQVLRSLFEISVGKIQQIKITSGAEGAFIGAVAEWLFDLNVQIPGVSDNTPQGQFPHVIIHYLPSNSQASPSTGSQIQCRTFFLQSSGNFWSQLGARGEDESSCLLIYRVPWQSCFYRSFGSRFRALSKLSIIFRDFIGSAARVYTAFAIPEHNVGLLEDSRYDWRNHPSTSHGEGFVAFLLSTFPELQADPNLAEFMHQAVNKTFQEALQTFQKSVVNLRSQCACGYCSAQVSSSRKCLVRLASTVLRLSNCLISIDYAPNLMLTVSGIQSI